MKFRVTEGINPHDGRRIFRVYEEVRGDWVMKSAFGSLEQCEIFIDLMVNPKPEVTVWEREF